MSLRNNVSPNNGNQGKHGNNSSRSGFEKREKRRQIRQLQEAISHHDIDSVKTILQNDFDVDFQYNSQTSLQLAVCEGSVEICSLLIKKGANVNQANAEGNSLLNMACWRGFGEIAMLLVENGADVDSQNESGNTSLNVCAYKNFLDIAEILLAAKCSTNLANGTGHTPLFCVSQNGNFNFVKLLLKADADPNWGNHTFTTPLMAASEMGHLQIVKELLLTNADPNLRNRQGRSAVFEAASRGHVDIIHVLHHHKANLNLATVKGVTPLLEAIDKYQTEAARLLINLGCDVNLPDRKHHAPIHSVIRQVTGMFSESGNLEMRSLVIHLVGAGADVNKTDGELWTPLYQAALSGDLDMCKLLIAQGACLDKVTKQGSSILHASVHGANKDIVKLCLEKGSSVNCVDGQGQSPLIAAVTSLCKIEIIEMLLDANCDQSITAKGTQNTALHESLLRYFPAAAQLLVDRGSSLTAVNQEKKSPLFLACQSGLTDIVSSMLSKGCPTSSPFISTLPVHGAATQGRGATIKVLSDIGCDLNQMNERGETPIMTAIMEQNFSAVRALLHCGCDIDAHLKVKGLQLCCVRQEDSHPHLGLEPLFLAMSQKSMDIMRMLLQCYRYIPRKTIRLLQVLLQKTQDLNTHYSLSQKQEIYRLFAEFSRTPFTLSDACRRCIRDSLGSPIERKVQELPVGDSVKRYILMEEEFAVWMEKEQDKPGGSMGSWGVFMHRDVT